MTQKPIERSVLRQINRVAHARALEYEKRIKADLMARIQIAKSYDVPIQARLAMVERFASTLQ